MEPNPPRATPGSALGSAAVVVAGCAAGAIAAAAAGLVDGLWSWSDLTQFVPGPGGKLRVLVFLAACYGLAGALAGALAAVILALFWRHTRLGDLIRAALARHAEVRAADPRQALIGLSLTIAAIPCVAGALGLAYRYGAQALAARKHMGLIIASAMGLALFALLAGALLSFILARPIELGLRALARRPGLGRALSSVWAPFMAAALLVGASGLFAVIKAWDTLALLPLRPLWIALAAAVFSLSTARMGVRLAGYLVSLGALPRRAAPVASAVFLIAIMLVAGSPEGVRKAAGAYSGLGGPITRAVRTAADLDRDGYSSILGGGDCDDLRGDVHPGAVDIPDDGIDQNCVGGDLTLSRSIDEVGFAPVPDSLAPDFNVVLITVDTVRADHVSAYGYQRPTTPNIDQVAREGALFLSAWAHAPSTRYSIPAILTGRYPLNVVYDYSIPGWPGLSEKNTTIAEHLERAGRGNMATGAILNYWYFDRSRRMDQGFDQYDNHNQRLHKQVPGQGPAQTKGSSSKEQTDKALEFVARHAGERFFLWVHYYDPHYEYEMHSEVPSFGPGSIDRYDHEIRFTDHHIGRLIDDLRRRGLYQRTILVITGDHGEGFGEHGIDMHGYHLYAPQTRVPLIMRVPGLAPVVVSTPVGHVDILPTLANLAGQEPSTDMMGRSLVDILAGSRDPDEDRHVFQQLSYEGNHEMRAAASKQCHVIYNVSPDTSWELYRIDTDPLETRDVIDRPGPCSKARGVLEAWYDRWEAPPGAAEALLGEPPEIADPVVVDLGDEVRLLGVDLPEGPVRAGDSFEVTYTFEARGRLPGGWKVFAHFEGPRGRRFQGDHAPPRPFAWWRPGQYIRYTQSVTVPESAAPGVYELWMGLFRKSERRPASSQTAAIEHDRARVGSVQVAPR
jgi:arylsulfatase A-like enzyme